MIDLLPLPACRSGPATGGDQPGPVAARKVNWTDVGAVPAVVNNENQFIISPCGREAFLSVGISMKTHDASGEIPWRIKAK